MTLVANPSDPVSNSYLDVSNASALAAEDLGPEAESWLKSSEEVQEAALLRATREVDAFVATGWEPYHGIEQLLVFPRSIDRGIDLSPLYPRKVILATYQQALYLLKNKDALASMNAHRARAGDVDPDAAYGVDPANGPSIISPMAMHYLAGFRTAPRVGKGGGIGSTRVASGFPGTW